MKISPLFFTLPILLFIILEFSLIQAEDSKESKPTPKVKKKSKKKKLEAPWVTLFNGKDFDGWKASENPDSFTIEDKVLIAHGKRAHLFYMGSDGKASFKNFHLKMEVKTNPNSNSGIFFHTQYQEEGWPTVGYECQVNQTEKDPKKTGSVYAKKNIYDQHVNDNEWFICEIIVLNNKVTIKLNNKTVNSYHNVLESGTIALQAHDPVSKVFYKNIQIKSLEPDKSKWYNNADLGPYHATSVSHTSELNAREDVAALKGLVIRLDKSAYNNWLFDTELLNMTGFFSQGLNYYGTPWNGSHGGMPYPNGGLDFHNSRQPGWAYQESFKDPRPIPHGPLPRYWAKYKGLYRHGRKVILNYSVDTVDIHELPGIETYNGINFYTRHLHITANEDKLLHYLADITSESGKIDINEEGNFATLVNDNKQLSLSLHSQAKGLSFIQKDNQLVLKCDASAEKRLFKIAYSYQKDPNLKNLFEKITPAENPITLITGGPSLWPTTIEVTGLHSDKKNSYVVDDIPLPTDNPWQSNIRFGGFDFFADGDRAACCTWNGDVWIISGLKSDWSKLIWKRYATGLFESLGLKIVDDKIYVTGKDQITRLHDLDKDDEADYYENFNNDIMITRNFHEFTFDLQTDSEGNFYFAKADTVRRGGRGFDYNTPHNGIIFKVSEDGLKSVVYATGIRAPGGCGVSPDGIVTTGENEGTWVPQCKITWTTKKGQFHGVVPSIWKDSTFVKVKDGAPKDYSKPLCWIPHDIDNSSGGQTWITTDKWGPFQGDLLHLTYGKSAILKVMKEEVNGQVQGGVFKIPVQLNSSAMRGRFNPHDNQLYVIGFKGWQTNAPRPCALQRIRYTGQAVAMPHKLNVTEKGIQLSFTCELDEELAKDLESYTIKQWNYIWGPMYGTPHVSVNKPNKEIVEKAYLTPLKGKYKVQDNVLIKSCTLLEDKKTVFLEIPDIKPCMQMHIKVDLESNDGKEILFDIYNTIHKLGPPIVK